MAKNNKDEHKKEIDKISGVETTGHEWDGIKELNTPAPRWWLVLWLLTVIFSVGYWFLYPTWPTLTDHTKGSLNWSQYKQLKEQQADIMARKSKYLDEFKTASFEDIKADSELYAFAIAGGKAVFKDYCAACHGTGAAGVAGKYPNLNDDDWIWGGSLDDIYTTIKYGIRSEHDDTRFSDMPAFGRDELLDSSEIEKVVQYVMSMSGNAEASPEGAQIFAENCSSCHGENGKGMYELGAPNLSDAIWLYGGDKDSITETVTNSRRGVMPAWVDRLSDDTIRQLTLYIHSLGGGQ